MKYGLIVLGLMIAGVSFAQEKRVRPKMEIKGGVTKPYTTVTTVPVIEDVTGVVHVTGNACGTYIEISGNEGRLRYYPTNLPAQFNKDEMNIIFNYSKTTDDYPKGCGLEGTITVEEVRQK